MFSSEFDVYCHGLILTKNQLKAKKDAKLTVKHPSLVVKRGMWMYDCKYRFRAMAWEKASPVTKAQDYSL